MQEIERKFLVKNSDYKSEAFKQTRITQGFLNTHPERTVRIRIKGDTGFITVKGKSNQSGTSRFEWEKEIPLNEAKELLLFCETGVIDKTRYEVKSGNHIFEIDEFYGDNQNLIIDTYYNPNTFNPLKYNFPMSSRSKKMYRIGNTHYIISIKALN